MLPGTQFLAKQNRSYSFDFVIPIQKFTLGVSCSIQMSHMDLRMPKFSCCVYALSHKYGKMGFLKNKILSIKVLCGKTVECT
jgi:hypothetical protein